MHDVVKKCTGCFASDLLLSCTLFVVLSQIKSSCIVLSWHQLNILKNAKHPIKVQNERTCKNFREFVKIWIVWNNLNKHRFCADAAKQLGSRHKCGIIHLY